MNKKHHVVGWFEIYVEDMDRAKKFYEEVLQIKMDKLETPDSSMQMVSFSPAGCDDGEEKYGCPGALVKMDGVEPGGGGTMVYFHSEDCALEESRVVAAGGHVHVPKSSIGDHGYMSLIVDSEKNMVGIHSMK